MKGKPIWQKVLKSQQPLAKCTKASVSLLNPTPKNPWVVSWGPSSHSPSRRSSPSLAPASASRPWEEHRFHFLGLVLQGHVHAHRLLRVHLAGGDVARGRVGRNAGETSGERQSRGRKWVLIRPEMARHRL